jgi:hypothetical protein
MVSVKQSFNLKAAVRAAGFKLPKAESTVQGWPTLKFRAVS